MRVYRLHKATNEIEGLDGKYRGTWDEITRFERLLSHLQTHGHERMPGLQLQRHGQPAAIWKAKVLHPLLGGKSSGLRYIYERFVLGGEDYAVALTVYVHQERNKETEVRSRIRQRFESFDATTEGLRKLDGSDTDKLLR